MSTSPLLTRKQIQDRKRELTPELKKEDLLKPLPSPKATPPPVKESYINKELRDYENLKYEIVYYNRNNRELDQQYANAHNRHVRKTYEKKLKDLFQALSCMEIVYGYQKPNPWQDEITFIYNIIPKYKQLLKRTDSYDGNCYSTDDE